MLSSNQTPQIAARDIERRIRTLLAKQGYPALRSLSVTLHGDHVVISGCVSTFHEKQIATRCAQQVAGDVDVVNKVDVPSHLPM